MVFEYVNAGAWIFKISTMKTKQNSKSYVEYLRNSGIKYLYHFTSKKNLESIKRMGGLYSWWQLHTQGIIIPCAGGNELSRNLDVYNGLQDYVRLSLCPDHPMAYKLKKSGEDIIVLKISLDVVEFEETLFSDMNATDSQHHHGKNLEDLKRINIAATQRRYVRRDDPAFKALQAEIMAKTFIPSKYIINLNCA